MHLFTHNKLRLCGCCRLFQVSLVLSALQAGNKGTQACITAESAVSGIIADLDTTIMFASAGTLNPENEESFADHRYADLAARSAVLQTTPGAAIKEQKTSGRRGGRVTQPELRSLNTRSKFGLMLKPVEVYETRPH